MSDDLEGRIVLIAGDSDNSRELRDHIGRDLIQDHEVGGRVVYLDSSWRPYSGGDQNFDIVDPNGRLEWSEIEGLIRNGDTYFVSKLENPLLANPLKYVFDPLVEKFGREYASLRLQKKAEKINNEELENRFLSYVGNNLPVQLKGLIDKKQTNKDLQGISKDILGIFNAFGCNIEKVFENPKAEVNLESPRLDYFKLAFEGYLSKIMKPRDKQHFLDELQAISYRVGKDILQEGDVGRFGWITPGLDGRSDHNKKNRNECKRTLEYADMAKDYNVSSITLIRAHSPAQLKFYEDRNIYVKNITQTNEIISRLVQDDSVDFSRICLVSPDEGGLADTMVFARELYRRTKGEYDGRIIVNRKVRDKMGNLVGMEFLASYVYDPSTETEEDFEFDDRGNPLPYDIVHAKDFKYEFVEVPSKDLQESDLEKIMEGSEQPEMILSGEYVGDDGKIKTEYVKIPNPAYIGNKFKKTHGPDQVDEIKSQVNGYTGILRDDLVASGGTSIFAMYSGVENYGLATFFAGIENGSLTGNAIRDITKAVEDGVLTKMYISTAIKHPNLNKQVFHEIPISGRIKNDLKRQNVSWLKEQLPEKYERLEKYSVVR